MYKENEKLILLEDLGEKDEPKYIPKHSELIFIKALDHGFQSYVVAQYNDRIITLPEIAVKPKNTNPLKVLNKININLMDKNPELKIYHPNLIIRYIYRFINFVKIKLNKSKTKKSEDFSFLKSIINEDK